MDGPMNGFAIGKTACIQFNVVNSYETPSTSFLQEHHLLWQIHLSIILKYSFCRLTYLYANPYDPLCEVKRRLRSLLVIVISICYECISNFIIIYHVRQKTVLFYFCNIFIKPPSILIIFGTHILQ